MFDIYLRVVKERILEPAVYLIQSFNITPNQISLVAFAFGILCTLAAASGSIFWSVLFWSLNRLLDGVDGVVARRTNQVTDFGGYLDIILDFIIYGIVPIGIVHAHFSVSICYVVMFLECTYFVNAAGLFYLSAILEKNSLGSVSSGEMTTVTMPTAFIEGSETVIGYFIFLLFPRYAVYTFTLFGIGVAATIVQRLMWAEYNLKFVKKQIDPLRMNPSLGRFPSETDASNYSY